VIRSCRNNTSSSSSISKLSSIAIFNFMGGHEHFFGIDTFLLSLSLSLGILLLFYPSIYLVSVMDQALQFFKENNGFDCLVLIKLFQLIKKAVVINGFVSEKDLHIAISTVCMQTTSSSDCQFSNLSVAAYSSIVLNTCMEVFISASGNVAFKFRKNISNEDDFLDSISKNLREFQHSNFSTTVRDLASKLDRYRKRTLPSSSVHVVVSSRGGIVINNNKQQRAHAISIEKSEPVVELMAKLRKLGMDAMFPLKTHDKVLACIFISASVLKKPVAHRELIDLVIEVKESSLFPDFEDVSKTKIRGMLALLKHSHILEPYLFEEDPVKLKLVDSIQNFTMLRKVHDSFLLS